MNISEAIFTAVYPKFNEKNNTWNVEGNPNGDIKIENKIYPYLYYECESYFVQEIKEGFVVEDKNELTSLKKS